MNWASWTNRALRSWWVRIAVILVVAVAALAAYLLLLRCVLGGLFGGMM